MNNGDSQGQPFTLCYGLRLSPGTAREQDHPNVKIPLPDGSEGDMTLHVINGTREEIKKRLYQSIDALFEIYEDEHR